MRAFAGAYAAAPKVKQLVSQIPWGHIIRILQKIKASVKNFNHEIHEEHERVKGGMVRELLELKEMVG